MGSNFSISDTEFSITDENGATRVKVGVISASSLQIVTGRTAPKSKPQLPTNESNWMAPDDWSKPLWTERWSHYFSSDLRNIWAGLSEVQKLALSKAFNEMADDMYSLAIESAGY